MTKIAGRSLFVLIALVCITIICFHQRANPGELGISLFFYNYDFGFQKRALIGSFIYQLLQGKPMTLAQLICCLSLLQALYGLAFAYLFYLIFCKENQEWLSLLCFALVLTTSPFFLKQAVHLNVKVDFIGSLLFLCLAISYLMSDYSPTRLFGHQITLMLSILFLSLMHEAQLLLTIPFLVLSFAYYLRVKLALSYGRILAHLIPAASMLTLVTAVLVIHQEPGVAAEQLTRNYMQNISDPDMFFGKGPLTTGSIRVEPLYSNLQDNIAITANFYRPNLQNFLYGVPRYIIVFAPFLLFFWAMFRFIAVGEIRIMIVLWSATIIASHAILSVIAIDTMRWSANAMLYWMILPLLLAGYSSRVRATVTEFLNNNYRWTTFTAAYAALLQPVGTVFPNTFYGF